MKFIIKLILRVLANALGLYLSARYIPGFIFSGDLVQLFILALILTMLNFLVKPILKILLSPFIILTLGLGLVLVNMVILHLLDFFSPALTITDISALFLSSILVAAVNIVLHLVA